MPVYFSFLGLPFFPNTNRWILKKYYWSILMQLVKFMIVSNSPLTIFVGRTLDFSQYFQFKTTVFWDSVLLYLVMLFICIFYKLALMFSEWIFALFFMLLLIIVQVLLFLGWYLFLGSVGSTVLAPLSYSCVCLYLFCNIIYVNARFTHRRNWSADLPIIFISSV